MITVVFEIQVLKYLANLLNGSSQIWLLPLTELQWKHPWEFIFIVVDVELDVGVNENVEIVLIELMIITETDDRNGLLLGSRGGTIL